MRLQDRARALFNTVDDIQDRVRRSAHKARVPGTEMQVSSELSRADTDLQRVKEELRKMMGDTNDKTLPNNHPEGRRS